MDNWLTKRATLSPKQTALVYQGQAYSFAQVYEQVRALTQKIATLNLQSQDRVALFGQNSWQMYLNILALQQLNVTLVLLNTRLAANELQDQLADAQVKYCFCDQNQVPENLRAVTNTKILTPKMLQNLANISYQAAELQDSDIASIMYTSGTTGKPKGVIQTYGNHWASAMNTLLNFQVTQQDAWLCVVPLFHISGFSILLRSLIYGIPIYLEPKFSAATCHQLLITQKITIFSVVPTMLQELLAVNPQATPYNSAFRLMFLGGAPSDSQTLQQCQERQIPLVQSYGMTETCSNIVALNPADATRKPGSCGQALFTNQVRISSTGEIQLKSPALAPSYWQNDALFQQKLTPDGWFKTGDVGYLDEQNYLFVQGRSDDMFVSGGENIFPNEIEAVYQQIPAIKEIVVDHQADNKWGAVPIAYLIDDASLTKAQLQAFGRQNLAHYKVPVEFRRISAFPRTGSGKIQRHALAKLSFELL
ncbi:o-succinylbenzoate--CoA ligase [Bombilactobacillus thymidiniphilus]|uniref:2-succinylbenzoate--CoA ligase n=1 Tax=Bombilactobacillus thymidiniphilus TaxID=2923363 RepID=A0ABY4PBT0_9LACO|nr:o-succinylbenzoate--CoA ligase [Bombilactobacillus thymidiniphilus]UQS83123.1 o-succinylbenzoate--CoA ligase [Bombilactobacillus thymidiniphilus]